MRNADGRIFDANLRHGIPALHAVPGGCNLRVQDNASAILEGQGQRIGGCAPTSRKA
jgi:hypothetical protein